MKQRMWSRKELIEVTHLAPTHTAKQIAERLGRTAAGVQEFARRNKIKLMKRGEAHYNHKLTKADIARIKDLRQQGATPTDIALAVGVHKVHIYSILAYAKRWRETMELDK